MTISTIVAKINTKQIRLLIDNIINKTTIMDIKHTNEMKGTLLVELLDGNVYEVSRHNSGYSVRPDKGHRVLTSQEELSLIKMFNRSSCSRV